VTIGLLAADSMFMTVLGRAAKGGPAQQTVNDCGKRTVKTAR
jgi:hypothetical protein